jgi:hypothetical protein
MHISFTEFSNEVSMFHSEISKSAFCQCIRIFILFSLFIQAFNFLRTVCDHIVPKSVETQWNFQTGVMNLVYVNRDAVLESVDIIQNENV